MQTLLTQWREVDKAASEAEKVLFDAAMLYAAGNGPKPSDESMDAAKALREQAKVLFDRAIGQFGPINVARKIAEE
jgi:hypothetical protein